MMFAVGANKTSLPLALTSSATSRPALAASFGSKEAASPSGAGIEVDEGPCRVPTDPSEKLRSGMRSREAHGRLDDVERRHQVVVKDAVGRAVHGVWDGGRVDDGVVAADGGEGVAGVGEVGLPVRRRAGDAALEDGRAEVQRGHLVPGVEQRGDRRGADHAARAGEQDSHRPLSCPVRGRGTRVSRGCDDEYPRRCEAPIAAWESRRARARGAAARSAPDVATCTAPTSSVTHLEPVADARSFDDLASTPSSVALDPGGPQPGA
jgi:hypothetical protein